MFKLQVAESTAQTGQHSVHWQAKVKCICRLTLLLSSANLLTQLARRKLCLLKTKMSLLLHGKNPHLRHRFGIVESFSTSAINFVMEPRHHLLDHGDDSAEIYALVPAGRGDPVDAR